MTYFSPTTSWNGDLKEIFSLPNLHKVMSGVKVEQNKNGTLCKYQDITLQYYESKKESIRKNTTKYIDMILEALTERFSALFE